jgi:hypothetical protein
MSQLILFKVHQEHQERMINALPIEFPGLQNPFVIFSDKLYALQINDSETDQVDLVIVSDANTFLSFLNEKEVMEHLYTESQTPLIVESYNTALNYFDLSNSKRISTDSSATAETLKALDFLAKQGSSVSQRAGNGQIQVWKYKQIYAIKVENSGYAVFADATVLANEIFACRNAFL